MNRRIRLAWGIGAVLSMVGWPALAQDEQGKQQPKAQDYEQRIREIVRELEPDPLRGDAYTKVRRIVAMGRGAVPALTKLLKEGVLHGGVLDASSFLLRPGDEEAVKVIREYAFAPRTGGSEEAVKKASWWEGAVLALLRIGGTAARSVIDRVAEKEDWEFQIKAVDASWLMLGVEDLEYAKGVFEGVVRDRPEWRISKFLRVTQLPRIHVVLGILRNQERPETVQRLFRIVQEKDGDFITVTAGRAQVWALKLLVEVKPDGAAEAVRNALREHSRKAREHNVKLAESSPFFYKAYLQAIRALEGSLTAEEQDWLQKNPYAYPFPENILTAKDLGLE